MCDCTSGISKFRARANARPGMTLPPIAVLGVLADVLDRHHMFILGGIEYDDALGRAARLSGQRMTEMSFLEIKDGVDLLMIVNC